MKNIKQISNNDLYELLELLNRMQYEISNFSHVEEFINKQVLSSIENNRNKVIKELDRREKE